MWLMCSSCGPLYFLAAIIGSNFYKVSWDLSICKNNTMRPLVVPDGGPITAAAPAVELQNTPGDIQLGL